MPAKAATPESQKAQGANGKSARVNSSQVTKRNQLSRLGLAASCHGKSLGQEAYVLLACLETVKWIPTCLAVARVFSRPAAQPAAVSRLWHVLRALLCETV